jgi:hypothetical protein
MMKRFFLIFISTLLLSTLYSQNNNPYRIGLTAEQNLNAIGNLSPTTPGGMGFDNRYEGVVGSSRLFDTLLPSLLNIKDQDYYLKLESDIDLMKNTLIFLNPKTRKLNWIKTDIVNELVITENGKELIFRTTGGKNFEKVMKEERFYQVLKDGAYQFIKMPYKDFIEADYKGVYTSDRRYDEYKTLYKYFILKPDNIFYQTRLSKKSLVKLFPDKKQLIKSTDISSASDDEMMILSILEKF